MKFEAEVRKVLTENKGRLFAYDWNLAYPNGEQVTVAFASDDDIGTRISLFKARQPECLAEVYRGKARSEFAKEVIAQIEADAANASAREVV